MALTPNEAPPERETDDKLNLEHQGDPSVPLLSAGGKWGHKTASETLGLWELICQPLLPNGGVTGLVGLGYVFSLQLQLRKGCGAFKIYENENQKFFEDSIWRDTASPKVCSAERCISGFQGQTDLGRATRKNQTWRITRMYWKLRERLQGKQCLCWFNSDFPKLGAGMMSRDPFRTSGKKEYDRLCARNQPTWPGQILHFSGTQLVHWENGRDSNSIRDLLEELNTCTYTHT